MTTASHGRSRARTRREREREAERRRLARHRLTLNLTTISVIALVAGGLLIAIAIALGARPGSGPPATAGAPAVAGTFSDLPTNGYALGRADAPVTIDLYEDFQCPACRRWGELVFPSLAANELASGKARLVFHDFAFIGPESLAAARAGQAAARQNRFWDLWATIYANQGPENSGALATSRLVGMARAAGLDVDRFTNDMQLAATGAAIDASIASGRALGVTSTPTVAINGHLMVGASYDDIAAAVARAAGD